MISWPYMRNSESNALSIHTRWFVFRLSICFLKTSIHMSLHRNLITSNVSVNLGRSLENLAATPESWACTFLTWPGSCLNVPTGSLARHAVEVALTSPQAPAQLYDLGSPASEKQPPSVRLRLWPSHHPGAGLRARWLACKPSGPFRLEADPCMMHWERLRMDRRHCMGEVVSRRTLGRSAERRRGLLWRHMEWWVSNTAVIGFRVGGRLQQYSLQAHHLGKK